jgi:hypothetical protein
MSRLLQALLGANVDGSGSSFHIDKSCNRRDSLVMVRAKGTSKEAPTRKCAKTVAAAGISNFRRGGPY